MPPASSSNDGRSAYNPHLSPETYVHTWQCAMGSGNLQVLGTDLGVVDLPQGVVGILPIVIQVLLDHASQGQTPYEKPGTALHAWIVSDRKWRPWMLHESVPGVPDWLWLDLALPQIRSLQDKTKKALPPLLAPYHAALTDVQRQAFVGALVEGDVNPAMKGRPLTYPWIDAARPSRKPQSPRWPKTSDLRAPEHALPMLVRLAADPQWSHALQTHVEPILALFERWGRLPKAGFDADRERRWHRMNYLAALGPVLRAEQGPHAERWFKAWPLPDPYHKGLSRNELLMKHWAKVIETYPIDRLPALLSKEDLALLDSQPELTGRLQARARLEHLARQPATARHRPRYRS